MKIGILGSRGIPNNHGGFEQFAEKLSVFLASKGDDVIVYNSHKHPYVEKDYKGVKIVHCYDPEFRVGTAGQFLYDYNCIWDARKRNFDVILQLGYTSSSIWAKLLPQNAKIITNMDGLEWKRCKYSPTVQKFLKRAEKWAVFSSHVLVADSIGIQNYIKQFYGLSTKYIPYGADVFITPNFSEISHLPIERFHYSLLIARIEPENNIETIIKGYVKSKIYHSQPLIVVGKWENTTLGKRLKSRYKSFDNIIFFGSIYDIDQLNNLRYYSKFYFHGHSVGGTNPSLLEAMASQALIVAHNNEFNQSILENHGFYFSTETDITAVLNSGIEKKDHPFLNKNIAKINEKYSWKIINNDYFELFHKTASPN